MSDKTKYHYLYNNGNKCLFCGGTFSPGLVDTDLGSFYIATRNIFEFDEWLMSHKGYAYIFKCDMDSYPAYLYRLSEIIK